MDDLEAYTRLKALDEEISRLTTEEITDSRVGFEYSIRTAERKGRYRVKLFIEPRGTFSLNEVDRVIYLLHPSFNPSKVAVKNPQTKFALELDSWGDFHAMAVVVFKSGEAVKLIRYLPIGIGRNQMNRPAFFK